MNSSKFVALLFLLDLVVLGGLAWFAAGHVMIHTLPKGSILLDQHVAGIEIFMFDVRDAQNTSFDKAHIRDNRKIISIIDLGYDEQLSTLSVEPETLCIARSVYGNTTGYYSVDRRDGAIHASATSCTE